MESITRTRRSSTSTDSYGQPVYTTTSVTLQAKVSARVSGTNFDADQIVITDGLTLYLDSGADVQDDDKFTVRGKIYEIDGEAFDWQSGLGSWNPGLVVNLQREKNRGK
jgi:SPP1 family predicted phage head-tail adaptor